MADTMPRYDAALFDQAAFIWVLHKHPDWLPRIHFEEKLEFGFHYHYAADLPLEMLGNTEKWMHPLIMHYAGEAPLQ